jgi:hypothetical protein
MLMILLLSSSATPLVMGCSRIEARHRDALELRGGGDQGATPKVHDAVVAETVQREAPFMNKTDPRVAGTLLSASIEYIGGTIPLSGHSASVRAWPMFLAGDRFLMDVRRPESS